MTTPTRVSGAAQQVAAQDGPGSVYGREHVEAALEAKFIDPLPAAEHAVIQAAERWCFLNSGRVWDEASANLTRAIYALRAAREPKP